MRMGQASDYAARLNETPEMAAQAGMAEVSKRFREMGEKLYIAAKN
jgi:phosphomethylpyrimidine synthase